MTLLLVASVVFAMAQVASPQVVINTATCGTSKGCWSSSSGCTQGTCQFLLTYAVDPTGQNMVFELSGQATNASNVYMAMALSTTGVMGSFYSVACYNNSGQLAVSNGYIYRRGFNYSTNNLFNTSISMSNNFISCTFTRSRQATGYSDDLTPANASFFLLAATGALTAGNPPRLLRHSSRLSSGSLYNMVQYANATTPAPGSASSTNSGAQAFAISTANCGSTVGCWLSTPGCTQQSCAYLLTWTPNVANNYVSIQLSAVVQAGASSPYVAMAFSNDQMMGNDYAIGCWLNGSSVVVQDGRTIMAPPQIGHFFNSPINVGVSVTGGWYYASSNILSCSFNRQLTAANNPSAKNLTAGNLYYLLIAVGTATMPGYGFTQHVNTYISSAPVDITNVTMLTSGNTLSPFVKVHASLMILAWMVAVPIGSLVGRHYRLTLALKSKVGEKVWFQLHRSLQIVGTILTVISFVLIFVGTGGYVNFNVAPDYAHPIVGIITTCLCVINFCVGLANPGPAMRKKQRGFLFRRFHMLFGMASLLLSFATIIVALVMNTLQLPAWLLAFPIAFIVAHLVANITLEAHKRANTRKQRSSESAAASNEVYLDDLSEQNTVTHRKATSELDQPDQPDQLDSTEQPKPAETSEKLTKPKREKKRVSMLNNPFRKNLLYAYSALVTAIAIAFIIVLLVLF